MLRYLILGMTYAFAAAVQPGPFQTFIISQSLVKGWRRTLPAALAPILSDGPIILLVLLVLTRVPAWLVPALQLVGGIFLLFLAFGAYKTWRGFATAKASSSQASQQTVLKAVAVNLLNPNPYLAWSLVMGPLLLEGWQEDPLHGIALLAGFYAVLTSCQVGIILLSAAAGNTGPRVSRAMVGISAIALACFGFYELWLGIAALS